MRKRRPDMDISVSSETQETVSFEAFLQQNKLCRLWKKEELDSAQGELAALPLETFLNPEGALPAKQAKLSSLFKEKVEAIQDALRKAKRGLVLSRSRSLSSVQARSLGEEASKNYETAKNYLTELKTLVRRMGPDDRRRVRALEGAAEWRRIRHAILQNQKTLKTQSEEIAA